MVRETHRPCAVKALSRRVVVAGAATLVLPAPLVAQSVPTGTVRLIVPFPPGGSVDAIARLVQPGLERRLERTVIIENRPGASGSVGATVVARAAPDGLTWLFVFDTHAVNPALLPSMPFDSERDLAPVTLIGTAPMVLVAHPSQRYATLADVLSAARAQPGAVPYGSIGNGSLGHLAMALLARSAGVTLNHVPYRGGGPLVADALGGHVPLAIGSTTLLASHLAGGTLRPVVQMGSERVPLLRQVPTVVESGFPGFDAEAWWAVFAPAQTPGGHIAWFRRALVETLEDAPIRRQLVESQQVRVIASEPDGLARFFAAERQRWAAVIREQGIRPD